MSCSDKQPGTSLLIHTGSDETGKRQGHQDRDRSLLLVLLRRKWPPGRRARCRHLGKVPLESLEWDCSPTAVMQAAASLLNNTEKQHELSQEGTKLPMAAQSRGAEHAEDSRAGHRGTTVCRHLTWLVAPKSRRTGPSCLCPGALIGSGRVLPSSWL